MSQAAILRNILSMLAFGWLALQNPTAAIPSQPLRVGIKVNTASLPVTIGVPLSEAANVLEGGQLGITDLHGNPVPSQIRVLSRWRGLESDLKRPVKWLLVDFNSSSAGMHFLTKTTSGNYKPVAVTDAASGLRIGNSQIEVEISKQGEGLLNSFKLNGVEMLRAPVSMELSIPQRAIITQTGAGLSPETLIVTDATLFKPGDAIQFEHKDRLKWEAPAGSNRLVTHDQSFAGNRRYRIDEGTPQQEEVEVGPVKPGDLQTSTALKFNHQAGAPIRDLSVEQESATIKSIDNQKLQLISPPTARHSEGEIVFVKDSKPNSSTAVIERTTIEESNGLRIVVRQDGFFRSSAGRSPKSFAFTLRFYIYADQPYVRARLRVINHGPYGFGASRTRQAPYTQHALLESFSLHFPTTEDGSALDQVLTADESYARIRQNKNFASLSAGKLEVGVPEFAENFPRTLEVGRGGMRLDLLPEIGQDYIFEGARAKTTDFYLGRNTAFAQKLTNSMSATLDPAYIASTGAVRPLFVERRDWAREFGGEKQLSEAASRVEKMFAASYEVESTEAAGPLPPTSIFEYRLRREHGEQFGWRNFGDLAWSEGYANVHYDLPFILLREYLRTGDARAFQLGGEMARYRADWGQYHADDYLDSGRVWNLKGQAFYEKGDHGSYREPVPSHNWIEGMWLYWAMTGDEVVHESALEGSEAFARMDFNYNNALAWNEPRWLGWPTLGLVVAYRYSGNDKYLKKANANVNLFVQAEAKYGGKGYYLGSADIGNKAVQPWAWSYALLGVIEYWRETGDRNAARLIVHVADWLIGKGSSNPPLKPGERIGNGSYLPIGVSYFWHPQKKAEDRSVALAGLCLPILTTAARITGRDDLWIYAKQLFSDYAFYRDFPDGKGIEPASRGVINFHTPQFTSTAPKVYGQMGLTVSEFLPELARRGAGSPRKQSGAQPLAQSSPDSTSRYSQPLIEPDTGEPVIPLTPNPHQYNLAIKRPTMASSVRPGSNVVGLASAANDGEATAKGKVSIWQSAIDSGTLEWWQVDLGKSSRITGLKILFNDYDDQPWIRHNFEVRGSNDLNFDNSVVLASQGEEIVRFRQAWVSRVKDSGTYRYVRVRKTKLDPDPNGHSYFNLLEVYVYSQPHQ